jgi:hypothetical protein
VRHAIRVDQAPVHWGTGAFVVAPARSSTASFNGQNRITAAPGTHPVPSPRPAALNDSMLGGPYNQPSAVSPDLFLPAIHVAHPNSTMHFPGRLFFHNVSPAPATHLGAVPKQPIHRARIGGRTVTKARRPFTWWPEYSGRSK